MNPGVRVNTVDGQNSWAGWDQGLLFTTVCSCCCCGVVAFFAVDCVIVDQFQETAYQSCWQQVPSVTTGKQMWHMWHLNSNSDSTPQKTCGMRPWDPDVPSPSHDFPSFSTACSLSTSLLIKDIRDRVHGSVFSRVLACFEACGVKTPRHGAMDMVIDMFVLKNQVVFHSFSAKEILRNFQTWPYLFITWLHMITMLMGKIQPISWYE